MPPFYPEKVNGFWRAPVHIAETGEFDCSGTAVSFECGVRVRMFVSIDQDGRLSKVRFVSSGCGWAVAAAEALADAVEGSPIQGLQGLKDASEKTAQALGGVPAVRSACVHLAVEALERALAERRNSQAAEWKGEAALICSCFGVAEDTIERVISSGLANSEEAVGEITRAGTGCGSCQMLIREILESTERL